MKRSTGDYETATFIVRMWRESADPADEASSWRGTAVHVQSGTERGIRELDGLVSFMQAWLQSHGADGDK